MMAHIEMLLLRITGQSQHLLLQYSSKHGLSPSLSPSPSHTQIKMENGGSKTYNPTPETIKFRLISWSSILASRRKPPRPETSKLVLMMAAIQAPKPARESRRAAAWRWFPYSQGGPCWVAT